MLQKIQNVYLMGLGALGALYASRLHDYDPQLLKIIADEKHREKYGKQGITVNGKPYVFNYVSPSDAGAFPPADLVIIAVKFPQLAKAIDAVRGFIGPDTRIISILNGISSEAVIGQSLGLSHLLYAYAVGMDAFREGTHIRYTQAGKIVFGEKNNTVLSGDVKKIADLFAAAGIHYEIPENMELALWKKFMLNVAANQVTAALKIRYGMAKKSKEAQELMYWAAREVWQVSQNAGTGLTQNDLDHVLDSMMSLGDEGTTSMCQDVLAHRPTEVDIFAGTVIAMGEKYGVPTPVNRVLYNMIKVIEQAF